MDRFHSVHPLLGIVMWTVLNVSTKCKLPVDCGCILFWHSYLVNWNYNNSEMGQNSVRMCSKNCKHKRVRSRNLGIPTVKVTSVLVDYGCAWNRVPSCRAKFIKCWLIYCRSWDLDFVPSVWPRVYRATEGGRHGRCLTDELMDCTAWLYWVFSNLWCIYASWHLQLHDVSLGIVLGSYTGFAPVDRVWQKRCVGPEWQRKALSDIENSSHLVGSPIQGLFF